MLCGGADRAISACRSAQVAGLWPRPAAARRAPRASRRWRQAAASAGLHSTTATAAPNYAPGGQPCHRLSAQAGRAPAGGRRTGWAANLCGKGRRGLIQGETRQGGSPPRRSGHTAAACRPGGTVRCRPRRSALRLRRQPLPPRPRPATARVRRASRPCQRAASDTTALSARRRRSSRCPGGP